MSWFAFVALLPALAFTDEDVLASIPPPSASGASRKEIAEAIQCEVCERAAEKFAIIFSHNEDPQAYDEEDEITTQVETLCKGNPKSRDKAQRKSFAATLEMQGWFVHHDYNATGFDRYKLEHDDSHHVDTHHTERKNATAKGGHLWNETQHFLNLDSITDACLMTVNKHQTELVAFIQNMLQKEWEPDPLSISMRLCDELSRACSAVHPKHYEEL